MASGQKMSLGAFIFALCFCSIFVAVGIGLTIAGFNGRNKYMQLQAHGVTVQGQIVKSWWNESTDRHGTTYTYYMYVNYPAAGRSVQKQFQCTKDDYSSHQQGSDIGVIYDPASPFEAALVGPSGSMVYRNNLIGGPIFTLAGLLFIAVFFYAWRQQNSGAITGGSVSFTKRRL